MWGYGYGGEMTWWMVVVDVLIAALVIAGIAALVIFIARQMGGSASNRTDARRLLDERFARGEIDDDEYQRRSATLAASNIRRT